MLSGILYIIDIILEMNFLGNNRPTTGADGLAVVANFRLAFEILHIDLILSAVLFAPAVIALYLVLRKVRKGVITIAVGLAGISIVLFIVFLTIESSLLGVGDPSIAGFILYAANLGTSVAGVILSFSIILIGLAMRNAVFWKVTAYFTIITGVLGVIGEIPLEALTVVGLLALVLLTAWFLIAGFKLFQLSRK